MFKLTAAKVFYGTRSYPLNGIHSRFQEFDSVDDIPLIDLADHIGHLTGFRREFTAKHIARQEFPGIKTKDGDDLVIPEQLYASADGYSITWERV